MKLYTSVYWFIYLFLTFKLDKTFFYDLVILFYVCLLCAVDYTLKTVQYKF